MKDLEERIRKLEGWISPKKIPEFRRLLKQQKIKYIDEKILMLKDILKKFIHEGHDQCYVENIIKDLQDQRDKLK